MKRGTSQQGKTDENLVEVRDAVNGNGNSVGNGSGVESRGSNSGVNGYGSIGAEGGSDVDQSRGRQESFPLPYDALGGDIT